MISRAVFRNNLSVPTTVHISYVSLVTLQKMSPEFDRTASCVVTGPLRALLSPRVYTLPMVRAIGKTMVQGKNFGPQVTVRRLSAR